MTTRRFLKLAFGKDAAMEIIGQVNPRLLRIPPLKLKLDMALTIADAARIDLPSFVEVAMEQRCKKCGCTELDCSQCIEKTGEPCYWVKEDLCSACVKPLSS
jgi:hypothetical protein